MHGLDSTSAYDPVVERRRGVALAHHFREAEGLSIAEIAERLGAPSTVEAYFYDPTGDKARAVKARYVGVCRAAAPNSRATLWPTRTARPVIPARFRPLESRTEAISP
jgi:hypothetical protein